MASEHTVRSDLEVNKKFHEGLQILLDTFHDTILLYLQDIHVVNFSDISNGFVNIIIMYETEEGRSVKMEALGLIDKNYTHTLQFIWQAMKRAVQEAPSDYSNPLLSLTLPTQRNSLDVLSDLM